MLSTTPTPQNRASRACVRGLKTRVWGFCRRPTTRAPVFGAQTTKPLRVAKAAATKTASGPSQWLSRDPLEERGGENLYGMVGNNPIAQIDYLGMAVSWSLESGEWVYSGKGFPNSRLGQTTFNLSVKCNGVDFVVSFQINVRMRSISEFEMLYPGHAQEAFLFTMRGELEHVGDMALWQQTAGVKITSAYTGKCGACCTEKKAKALESKLSSSANTAKAYSRAARDGDDGQTGSHSYPGGRPLESESLNKLNEYIKNSAGEVGSCSQ